MILNSVIGKDYPKKVIPLIDNSKSSLYIIMYDWRWYENDFACLGHFFNMAIVRAIKRGVKINVVVNSDKILTVLKNIGCKVKKPCTTSLLHAKIIIVDSDTLVIGSHNLSNNAFNRNFEASIIVQNCPIINDYIDFFNAIWQL